MNGFESMVTTSFQLIAKLVKDQRKFNRGMVVYSLIATANIVMLSKKIDQLTKEVAELKEPRGE